MRRRPAETGGGIAGVACAIAALLGASTELVAVIGTTAGLLPGAVTWLVATGGLVALCSLCLLPSPACARWPQLHGRASVFGNDPVQAFGDLSDNGIRALDGRSTALGGIAVMRRSTLGGWWWVCAPRGILRSGVTRCHLVRQTDIGPAAWTGRVLDVTAATARRAWRLTASGFPTDTGTWTLRYRGRRQRSPPT